MVRIPPPTVPALAVLTLTILACAGCQTTEDVLPPVVVHTPFDFDPTDDFDLPEWWTNGKQMLHLDADGGYALYATQSRYRLPFERGRWSQRNWTALRLEPYARLPREAVRGTIELVDDRFMLALPRYERLSAAPGPPRVPEDDLLGAWRGRGGSLELGADGRYTFSPAPADGTSPLVSAGHRGRWQLDDDALRLDPAPSAMPVFTLRVERGDDGIRLVSRDLELRRPESGADGTSNPST